MKRLLLIAIAALILLVSGMAQADARDRHSGHGYNKHRDYGYSDHDRRGKYSRHDRGRNRGHHRGRGHHRHDRHCRHGAGGGHRPFDAYYGYDNRPYRRNRHSHSHRHRPVVRIYSDHRNWRYCDHHGGYFRIGDFVFGYSGH